MSRAVVPIALSGDPVELYKLVTREIPKASAGNVIVRMVLRPVNPTDFLVITLGIWQKTGLDPEDHVVGSEGVGRVHELGEGVTNFKKGQRVIPLIFSRYYTQGYGLWRDYVEVPASDLVAVPDDISDELAAQFFINPWALYQMLKQLNVPKGEYFIQSAAASTLGRQVISLARHWGVKSINIVRRDSQIRELKVDLGADYVLNVQREDVIVLVEEITQGKKAWGALDPVLGDMTRIMCACTRNSGEVLAYGALSGDEMKLSVKDLMRGLQLKFFLVTDHRDDTAKRAEVCKEIFELMRQKILCPLSGKKFPLEHFKEAMIESLSPDRVGKVFLESYEPSPGGKVFLEGGVSS